MRGPVLQPASVQAYAFGQPGQSGQTGRQGFASLPIIGISAHAMDDERDELLACGMSDYVTKPIQRELLLAKLAAALAAFADGS